MAKRQEEFIKAMRYGVMPLLVLLFAVSANAQMKQPVKWYAEAAVVSKDEAIITITARIEEPWHIYSQFMEEGGPLPTTFRFVESDDYARIGQVKEKHQPIEHFDNTFLMPVLWFERNAVFTQRIKLNVPATTVAFSVEFMACTEEECLLPETKKLSVEIKADEWTEEPKVPEVKEKKAKAKPKHKKSASQTSIHINSPAPPASPDEKDDLAAAVAVGQADSGVKQSTLSFNGALKASLQNDAAGVALKQPGDEAVPPETTGHGITISPWLFLVVGFAGLMVTYLMFLAYSFIKGKEKQTPH